MVSLRLLSIKILSCKSHKIAHNEAKYNIKGIKDSDRHQSKN